MTKTQDWKVLFHIFIVVVLDSKKKKKQQNILIFVNFD